MCDKMNGGKPYEGWPDELKPIAPNFMDYVKGITNGSKVMTADDGDWAFRPITDEETARYGAEDVVKNYNDTHKGKPTSSLGKPMNDAEYRKFMGITW